MNTESPKPNWFVRVCIIAFLIFLGCLVAFSFRFGPIPFGVTSGIITVLALMVVALLAESFNSISVGSFLRLKRDVEKVEAEKKEAKEEVRELRTSLITLATTFQQSQVTNNFSGGVDPALLKSLGVVKASPEEIEDEKEESAARAIPQRSVSPEPETDLEDSWDFRRELRKDIHDDLVRRFSQKFNIPLLEIKRDVKFDSGLENPDPIMNRTMIYHGYVHTEKKEYFIETGPINLGSAIMIGGQDERLYVKLAKIMFYRQIKKSDAELVYLEALLPEGAYKRNPKRNFGRIADSFQPAIASNLLRLESFEISQQEFELLKTKTKNRLTSR